MARVTKLGLATTAVGLAVALAGCSTSAPATLTLATGDVLRGSGTITLNGQFQVANGRLNCTGTYEGRNVAGIGVSLGRKWPLTIRCSNGKTGHSDGYLYQDGQADVVFNDGSKARMTLGAGK